MQTKLIESSNNDMVEIDFREIWLKVVKHRQTLISSILICMVMSLLYSFIVHPVYKSTTRILVEGKPPKIVKVGDSVIPDYTDHQNYFNSQIEVLRSHEVAALVYNELGSYEPWGRRGKNPAHLKEIGRDQRMDAMMKNVKITPVRMTDIVEIGVEDFDPALAARIANLWTRAYILFSSTDQLVQHRTELEQDLDQQYKYFKDKHPVIQGLKSEIAAVNEAIANQQKRMFEASDVNHFAFNTSDSITNVKVLDQAIAPLKPERPKKALNLILALFVGGFIGFVLMFLFESLDQSIKTSHDIERLLGIPFLTAIPLYVQEANKPKLSPELMTLTEGHSPAGEAFRSLRTNILFSNPDLKKKILVVTSTMPSEGKTTVALNLATAFAKVEEKTLIIDADLRNPKLHYLFNIKRSNGVTDVLAMENPDLKDFIYPTQVPNLFVLNCGTLPPNPSELLGSKKMEALLHKLLGMYDRIILDTPPILVATDAVVLSAKSDGVIYVIKAGATASPVVIRALNHLISVHANIFGAVLSMVKPKDHGEYSYYYHYSKDAQKPKK
jgi:capsular exopolysaccharide synthesis family protein